jgi:hypothetical protein
MNEMIAHTGNYQQFAAACESSQVDFAPVAHLASIGTDWYIFTGPGLVGYTVAQQGHAGGDRWDDSRDPKRPVSYWTTPENVTQLEAWRLALSFITGRVDEDLASEWGES